jgi:hypothetical protein
MTCPICLEALETGSFPVEVLTGYGTHCGPRKDACHRTWKGLAQSHCTVCHRHFGSNAAGDAHRFGDYRAGRTPVCRDPKGFSKWETADGPIWGGRDPKLGKATAARALAARRGPVGDQEATETDVLAQDTRP